jgi:hypothetical protein
VRGLRKYRWAHPRTCTLRHDIAAMKNQVNQKIARRDSIAARRGCSSSVVPDPNGQPAAHGGHASCGLARDFACLKENGSVLES